MVIDREQYLSARAGRVNSSRHRGGVVFRYKARVGIRAKSVWLRGWI